MESKVSKTLLKVLGFASSLLLTSFAGVFAFMSLVALFLSIVEGGFINVVGCISFGAIACINWSIRKDPLV